METGHLCKRDEGVLQIPDYCDSPWFGNSLPCASILFPPPPKVVEEEQRIEEEFDERVKAELQAMSPAAREKRRLELELERERRRIQEEEERQRLEEERRILEDKRKREEEEKAAEYEELLAYAKEFVQKDPRVVAAIFKQWLQEDVEKGLA